MCWFAVAQFFSLLVDWFCVCRLSDAQKDIEILLLRHQLVLRQRRLRQPPRLQSIEKLTLAVLTVKYKTLSHRSLHQLRDLMHLVQPEAVLRRHRELVRRKGTQRSARAGRTRTGPDLEALVLRLARENPNRADLALYFERHERRTQYLEFREEGFPIALELLKGVSSNSSSA